MRPRPAARIDGSSAFVSATGPKMLVANIRSHTSSGVSSTIPAAEIPALCTSPYGRADRFARSTSAAASTDAGSVEVQSDADQPRIVGARTGRRPQLLHSRVDRAHRRDDRQPRL